MPRSLRIQSTAKPKSNLPAHMVAARLSICQDWAAPWEITSMTLSMSSPAFRPKFMPSDRPCSRPAMQTWLTILVSWPAPAGPIRMQARAKHSITGAALSKTAASPPHITVSAPFSAPAWPPETGASITPIPRSAPSAPSSRATSAEAVVWSTKTAPLSMPAKAPSSPRTTARRSSSLPTQVKTTSAPSAASRGVGAKLPPWSTAQRSALAAVRL